MLKGTRDGILKKVQPVSIHGQVSWDVYFNDVEDPDGQINVARVGPEAVMGHNLETGDPIQGEDVVGVGRRGTPLGPTGLLLLLLPPPTPPFDSGGRRP